MVYKVSSVLLIAGEIVLIETIRRETLRKLNNQFKIPSVRKPPPYAVSKTYVCDKLAKDVRQQNGPNAIKRALQRDHVLIPSCVLQI